MNDGNQHPNSGLLDSKLQNQNKTILLGNKFKCKENRIVPRPLPYPVPITVTKNDEDIAMFFLSIFCFVLCVQIPHLAKS